MTAEPYQLFPALDPPTEAALRSSIERWGVLVPVALDQHGDIIDGHQRTRIAGEVGVDFDTIVHQVANEGEALELAATLNAARRQLDPEQRRQVVADLRAQGHSERAIADALGVSPATVHRDIDHSTASGEAVQPDTVRGLDGKDRPATRPAHDEPGPKPYDVPLFGPGEAEAIVDELEAAYGDDVTEADVELAVAECVESKQEPTSAPRKPDLGGGISHPARYSADLIPLFAELLRAYVGTGQIRVLDPFAGTGRIHDLHPEFDTYGIELEREWAELHERTLAGDALELPFPVGHFAAIVTSPCYGNRLADSHNANDPERRRSYTHDLGRDLSDSSSGAMHWRTSKVGDEASGSAQYRRFHERAWVEAARVLGTGGLFVLNIKDHYRDALLQPVAAWHTYQLARLGFRYLEGRSVPTPGLRQGANAPLRAQEQVHVFRKGSR